MSFETKMTVCQWTRHNIPGDFSLCEHRSGNCKSDNILFIGKSEYLTDISLVILGSDRVP